MLPATLIISNLTVSVHAVFEYTVACELMTAARLTNAAGIDKRLTIYDAGKLHMRMPKQDKWRVTSLRQFL